MIYEYDRKKNDANKAKHKIDFEEAITIFEDPDLLLSFDRVIKGEERYLAVGHSLKANHLLVVHCYREKNTEEITRIISARKLTKNEEKELG